MYRVTGVRGESSYISFTAYRAGVLDRVVADLQGGELEINADGTLSLTVGGTDTGANWLDLGEDAAFVIIREYTHYRADGVEATFEVEQVSPSSNIVQSSTRIGSRRSSACSVWV